MTKQLKYSLLIFTSGFLLFIIIHKVTLEDETFVIVDDAYKKQRAINDSLISFSLHFLAVCCFVATILSGYSLEKKKSRLANVIFWAQLLILIIVGIAVYLPSILYSL